MNMLFMIMLMYSPIAVMSLVITCRVISVATELLRTSTGFTNPLFSLIIYVDWLKLTDSTVHKNVGTVTIIGFLQSVQ